MIWSKDYDVSTRASQARSDKEKAPHSSGALNLERGRSALHRPRVITAVALFIDPAVCVVERWTVYGSMDQAAALTPTRVSLSAAEVGGTGGVTSGMESGERNQQSFDSEGALLHDGFLRPALAGATHSIAERVEQ
jgi:hypothetical protein